MKDSNLETEMSKKKLQKELEFEQRHLTLDNYVGMSNDDVFASWNTSDDEGKKRMVSFNVDDMNRFNTDPTSKDLKGKTFYIPFVKRDDNKLVVTYQALQKLGMPRTGSDDPISTDTPSAEGQLDSDINTFVESEDMPKIEHKPILRRNELIIPADSKLELTFENIKLYCDPSGKASRHEIMNFLQLCVNQGLNPFIKDAYLIKYGNYPAQMVVSKDAFLKKAEDESDYEGFEAGIIVTNNTIDDSFTERQGSLLLSKEKLIGGWARVYRNGKKPFYSQVSFKEYFAGGKDKKNLWDLKPATMIRKVALVQAMREAFTASFQGMYDRAEIDTER